MSENTFVWTDELVLEFVDRHDHGVYTSNFELDSFKQSKKPKPEWEIVSFKHVDYGVMFRQADGYFHHVSNRGEGWCTGEENALGDSKKFSIFSVKRLSDGEVFSVGDVVNWDLNLIARRRGEPDFNIESFNINTLLLPHRMFVNNKNICIEYLSKVPPKPKPLFVTEDGVDKYSGDSCWTVTANDDWRIHIFRSVDAESMHSPWKYFHSKEKAEEYILLNKPVLSVNDVMHYLYDTPSDNRLYTHVERLKKIAKEKINK